MSRAILTMVLVAVSGCATVAPMQTASVVARAACASAASSRRRRTAGTPPAASFSGSASAPSTPMAFHCLSSEPTPGTASGRASTSASTQAQGRAAIAPERIFQFGLTTDVKGELLHVEDGALTHVVSTGLLGGAALSGRFGLPLWAQLEWGVPVFYGVQLAIRN